MSGPDSGGDVREALRHWQRAADKLENSFRSGGGFETKESRQVAKHLENVRCKTAAALAKPDASNASAEARLRDRTLAILGAILGAHENDTWSSNRNYIVKLARELVKALSAGGDEATKSEGGPDRNCSDTSRSNCEPERSPSDPTAAPAAVDVEADYDMSIHTNPDARAWAAFFMKCNPDSNIPGDLMVTWFSNAMMAMCDYLNASDAERAR